MMIYGLMHWFTEWFFHRLTTSLLHWLINSHESMVHWFIRSVVHGFFHVISLVSQPAFAHLLMCFWQRLSYKPLISYIAISFCSKLPLLQGPGTIWYPKSASSAEMPHLLTWNLVPYPFGKSTMDPWGEISIFGSIRIQDIQGTVPKGQLRQTPAFRPPRAEEVQWSWWRRCLCVFFGGKHADWKVISPTT